MKGIEEDVVNIQFDPFVKSRAFILTMTKHHYVTTDKGKSWSKFTSNVYEFDGKGLASVPKLEFNAADPNLLLMSNYECPDENYSHRCQHVFHYTKDGFKSASRDYQSMHMFVGSQGPRKNLKLQTREPFTVQKMNSTLTSTLSSLVFTNLMTFSSPRKNLI